MALVELALAFAMTVIVPCLVTVVSSKLISVQVPAAGSVSAAAVLVKNLINFLWFGNDQGIWKVERLRL